jgi:hypothetical protein
MVDCDVLAKVKSSAQRVSIRFVADVAHARQPMDVPQKEAMKRNFAKGKILKFCNMMTRSTNRRVGPVAQVRRK